MLTEREKKLSKFLSLVLRHQPEALGIKLDPAGWASVDELVSKIKKTNPSFTSSTLEKIVAENNKKRFTFSEDGLMIRAAQGHSVDVDLQLAPFPPPDFLYHGTATRFVGLIRQEGLLRGARKHVHLSENIETARSVGSRHGQPHVFKVDSKKMSEDGFQFYLSENGVWLTDHVPPEYLSST